MPNLITSQATGFTILGVRVRIHVSWLLMALFVAWSLAAGELPALYAGLPRGGYWLAAGAVVLGLGLSIVLHELAHTLVGRAMGVPVNRITLFLFGGVAELAEEPRRPGAELAMALAGPAFSVALGIALGRLSGEMQAVGGPGELILATGYLATLNLVLAAFNMTPAFPLDGGRVLRALLWMSTRDLAKATRWATRTGEVLAIGLMVLGLMTVFTAGAANGLWWILVGLFLHSAARGARKDLEARRLFAGHAIAELMAPEVERAPAALTLDRFVDERLLSSRHGLYPVERDGVWIGVVTPEEVLRVPREAWPRTTLGDICRPASETPSAALLDDAGGVLERMQALQVQRMPVVHGGAVVGIVTIQDLLRSVELWRRFGRSPA